jgi:molybdate transport system ATP-binding protein
VSLDVSVQAQRGALDLRVTLGVEAGEIVCVVGPNGAGKTTLLHAIAGLVPLTRGRVALDDLVLEDTSERIFLPPEARPIGVVFQDYLLFPHLTVLENVAFGLRCHGISGREAVRRAHEWLERVGLGAFATSKPAGLSGGQAQRVALVRALAIQPRLLMLDEPLSALDVTARAEIRRNLGDILASFRGSKLFVTHDPLEAMALADRLVVLEGGHVVQSGPPDEVAERPRSRYVAELVGVNLFRGRLEGNWIALDGGGGLAVADGGDGAAFAVVHPRAVALYRARPEGTPRNVWRGRVDFVDRESGRARVRIVGEPSIVAEVTLPAVAELGLDEGGEVWVTVKATEVSTYAA